MYPLGTRVLATPKVLTLPETNSSPLKMDGWKMIHLLSGWPIFRGYVSFREGSSTTKFLPASTGCNWVTKSAEIGTSSCGPSWLHKLVCEVHVPLKTSLKKADYIILSLNLKWCLKLKKTSPLAWDHLLEHLYFWIFWRSEKGWMY